MLATRAMPVAIGLLPAIAGACATCRPAVRASVYDGAFVPTLATRTIPWAAILVIAVVVARSGP